MKELVSRITSAKTAGNVAQVVEPGNIQTKQNKKS
jgi:hypothetical protein